MEESYKPQKRKVDQLDQAGIEFMVADLVEFNRTYQACMAHICADRRLAAT